jgi:hypothetical protein
MLKYDCASHCHESGILIDGASFCGGEAIVRLFCSGGIGA